MVVLALGANASPDGTEEPSALPTMTLDDERPAAAFIGGSASSGVGASDDLHKWTSLLANARGWAQIDFTRDDTGYLKASNPACAAPECANFVDTVAASVERGPSIVVVAGGEGDLSLNQEKVGEAISATYLGLRTGLPNALIIAVGPLSPSLEPSPAVLAVDAAVQRAAAATGATYVSLLAPNVLTASMLSADGTLINDAAHAAIAARVAEALQ